MDGLRVKQKTHTCRYNAKVTRFAISSKVKRGLIVECIALSSKNVSSGRCYKYISNQKKPRRKQSRKKNLEITNASLATIGRKGQSRILTSFCFI